MERPETFSTESLFKAMTTNKIFYLSLKGTVIDGENGSSSKQRAHFGPITMAEMFAHEEAFVHCLAKPLVDLYGEAERDVLCTEDWGTPIGDVSRTFITLTWRNGNGELLAMVQVEASFMRDCDCKVIPNPIVR